MEKKIFKDKAAVATAFAEYIVEQIAKAEQFHIALSGGSTPQLLFEILANAYSQKIDWKKVYLYWGDERCVPPDHEESNYGMTFSKLIQHIDIPTTNIFRVLGENDPTEEADRYGKRIEWNLPLKNNLPIFDFIILGMGDDGHTASIFPHQMDLLESENTCAVATHPDSGQKRITLTGRVINAAKQKHFLVTGASKRGVVAEIFTRQGSYQTYPAYYIKDATWWLDESAGGC